MVFSECFEHFYFLVKLHFFFLCNLVRMSHFQIKCWCKFRCVLPWLQLLTYFFLHIFAPGVLCCDSVLCSSLFLLWLLVKGHSGVYFDIWLLKLVKERRHSQDLIQCTSMGKELWQRYKHLRNNHRKSEKELVYFAPKITLIFWKM